ncbi:MAG: hypothetical protein MR448_04585 [Parabacteroides sp.]|nr:hypothetical protein [Parabacteroides sp.]
MVLLAFRPESSEPLSRVFLDALDHHYQVTPLHGIAVDHPINMGDDFMIQQ